LKSAEIAKIAAMIAKLSDTNGPEAAKIAAMIAKLPDLHGAVAKLEAMVAIYTMIENLPDLHGSEAANIAAMLAELPDLRGSEAAKIEAIIAKMRNFNGPEVAMIAAMIASRKLVAMSSKRPGFRGPDDPAFDPKNELLDLLWLAFSGGDEEEARFMRISPMLTAYFVDLGFSSEVASFISTAVVKDFVDLLPKRKGRQWSPTRQRLLEAMATRLGEIKQELRARGEKGSVHKKAMQLLQNEHERHVMTMAPDVGRYAPTFDYDALENYVRRSKKRSNK
jgi:hypothetical protein